MNSLTLRLARHFAAMPAILLATVTVPASLALIGISMTAGNAQAGMIIDHGSYFSVDAGSSRLNVLDFTSTAGMTWDEVEAAMEAGGALDGWRYANEAETADIFNSFGLTSAFGYDAAKFAGVNEFLGLSGVPVIPLGDSDNDGYYDNFGIAMWDFFYAPSTLGILRGLIQIMDISKGGGANSGHLSLGVSPESGPQTGVIPSHYTHLLVQDSSNPVPEPSSLALLGLGGIGMGAGAVRWRKRKSAPGAAGSGSPPAVQCRRR